MLLFMLLIIAILTEVRWNLNLVFICTSFVVKDVEHRHMFIGHLHFF
jgi:hypothetical protein